VGGKLVSGTTQQCTINTKNTVLRMYTQSCTIHNADTVAYTTHSGSYSTECKKEVVLNNYSGTQHSQWCTTRTTHRYILATRTSSYFNHDFSINFVKHFNISVLGVVVRGTKKHYVNVKTEQTLSTLWLRN